MKPRELTKMLEADGWVQVRVRGAHYQFKHPTKQGLVTVAVHGGRDIPMRDLKSIEKQSGMSLMKDRN